MSDLWSPPLCSSYFSCFQVVVLVLIPASGFLILGIYFQTRSLVTSMMLMITLYTTHTHIFVKVFFCRSRNITFTSSIHRLISDFQWLSRHHSNDKYTGFPYSWSSCHNQGMSKVMSVMTGNMELPRWTAHHHRWSTWKLRLEKWGSWLDEIMVWRRWSRSERTANTKVVGSKHQNPKWE